MENDINKKEMVKCSNGQYRLAHAVSKKQKQYSVSWRWTGGSVASEYPASRGHSSTFIEDDVLTIIVSTDLKSYSVISETQELSRNNLYILGNWVNICHEQV